MRRKERRRGERSASRSEEVTAGAFTGPLFLSPTKLLVSSPWQVRELEIQLEEERSQRSQAVSSRKQLEAELQEAEAQVEAATRGKEESLKQLRRLQVKQEILPYIEIDIMDFLIGCI